MLLMESCPRAAFSPSALNLRSFPGNSRSGSSHEVQVYGTHEDCRNHCGRDVPVMLSDAELVELQGLGFTFTDSSVSSTTGPFTTLLSDPLGFVLAESWKISALLTLGVLAAFKPNGWLTPGVPLVAQQSTIPAAGRGLFATKTLPKGYVLGAYPGRIRSGEEYRAKVYQYPETKIYGWVMDSGSVLDPTDAQGRLLPALDLVEGLPIPGLSVSTILALVNEPPGGGDRNLIIDEQGTDVKFVTEREIDSGEELFIDYGRSYDRSSYR